MRLGGEAGPQGTAYPPMTGQTGILLSSAPVEKLETVVSGIPSNSTTSSWLFSAVGNLSSLRYV